MPHAVSPRIPKYRKHKATGQAVVTLSGKDRYLGRHGTAASKAAYQRLIAEWLAQDRQTPKAGLSVNELILAYYQRSRLHYRKPDGSPTSELHLICHALGHAKALYGRTPAENFGPLALKAVRQRMIDAGLARRSINHHVSRIKRMFRWATENELVNPSVFHGLLAIAGLQRGRSEARETEPVRPVPEAFITAVRPHVAPQVWAMIELQRLTGMRPGEVCTMRPCDLETTGRIWTYRPASHKTEHHGHAREVYLGPRAQDVLRPWLKLDIQAYLFSPRDAEAVRNARKRANRKTPMTPSQAARRPKRHRRRPWREHYDVISYRNAIQRACRLAFPLPAGLGPRQPADGKRESRQEWCSRLTPEEKAAIRAWRRDHQWHPHQLRHNAATNLRKEFGVELARIILGHSTAFTTEIYAEADRKQAMEVMGRVG